MSVGEEARDSGWPLLMIVGLITWLKGITSGSLCCEDTWPLKVIMEILGNTLVSTVNWQRSYPLAVSSVELTSIDGPCLKQLFLWLKRRVSSFFWELRLFGFYLRTLEAAEDIGSVEDWGSVDALIRFEEATLNEVWGSKTVRIVMLDGLPFPLGVGEKWWPIIQVDGARDGQKQMVL